MNKNLMYGLFFLAVTGLNVSCQQQKNAQAQENKTEEKVRVTVEEVRSQAVDQIAEFTGTVEAQAVNNIAPSKAVRIDKIFVEVGDPVRKGQKLVQMDMSGLQQAKSQLDNYEIEFKRVDELYKIGGASKSEWDSKKTTLDVAKSSYDNLVENTQLMSPIDGIVTARNYDNGDMYNNGDPVLVVEQIRPVKIMISVSETYFTKVKKGMDVDVKLDVYENETFPGKVNLVYPTIDPQTRTFRVEIRLDNQNQKVRPGMYSHVLMNFGTNDHVVVPDRSIVKQSGSGDRYVYVYKDGKVSYNKVELGRRMGDTYELLSGVDNGSLVVTTGQSRLNDGMEVEITKN